MENEYLMNFINDAISVKAFFKSFNESRNAYKQLLPPDIFESIESLEGKDLSSIDSLRTIMKTWYKDKLNYFCECKLWSNNQKIPIHGRNQEIIESELEIIKHETPWLYLAICKTCKQAWFVAFDTVDDDFYLQKISDAEMNDIIKFDRYPKHFADNEKVRPSKGWFEVCGYKDISDWKIQTNTK